ncbi:MAG: flagellar basal-body rod protein FlgG [Chthonomonas sp.]|nr:flagellar basal-body rod protein FlgG [Chthonomonas sp.]
MMRALNTAGTGMLSQQLNLDVISNNLANVNTTAFKQQRAEFQDLMVQTFRASGASTGGAVNLPSPVQIGLGSKFSATATNFAGGPMQATGNPLDLAINGDGFFSVQKADGGLAYTRDGSFKLDATGLVVTNDGYPLVPNITVPAGAKAITVSGNGTVSAILPGTNEPTSLGQISTTVFANPSGLTRAGQNLYLAGGASGDAQTATPGQNGAGELTSSFVEGSNVQVVEEMVRMILAQRAYEINSKAIQTADDMLSILNNLKR